MDRPAFLAASAALAVRALPSGFEFASRDDARPIVERRTIDELVKDAPDEVARIRRAYANMFAWSTTHSNDPRSWAQQKLVHSRAATRGENDPAYVIHGSHHFFPWHRAICTFTSAFSPGILTDSNRSTRRFAFPSGVGKWVLIRSTIHRSTPTRPIPPAGPIPSPTCAAFCFSSATTPTLWQR